MTLLRINALVGFVAESRTERVLWLDPLGRGGFLIDLDDGAAMPVFRSSEEIDRLRSDALLADVADDPWLAPLAEATIPEGHRTRRDAAWALIRPLVVEQPDIFHPDRRATLVRQLGAEMGSNRFTLYRLLRRFWQRGMSPNALLPDYDRCGGRGKAKAVSEKKRGRISATGIAGVNVDADMRRLFRDTVTRHFAVNRRLDMAGCYDELINDHFTDLRLDEDIGRQKAVIRADLPTLRQFRYWFEKDNDVFRIERQRRTARVYDKDLRALLNTSTSEVFGPGSRYQIDATIADVYLVSRLNRLRIVGRPVLYVVIDVFSRMITGLYIGFEGPSWVGAMMAIANAATDKGTYCRSFGIEIGEADWPCRHMPDRLLGDRGEMIGSAVETLIRNFHVEIENTAPYRADWKGIVEQRFRLLPAKFRAYTPGYIEEDFQQRGARDYRLDGTLDIDEFTAIVIQCARYYNTQHLIRGYPRDAEMIAEEVRAIPIELWEWGVARRSGQLRAYPPDLVRQSVLPSDDATVTPHGIRFYGCFYTCAKAMAEHWFDRARQRGSWTVRVSYDPRCLNEVYLHGTDGGRIRFVPCVMTDRSAAYRDRTLWEIDQVRQEERRVHNVHQPQALQGRIDLMQSVKDIVATAEAKHAAAPAEVSSDHGKLKGIRDNRRQERRENQEREAFRFGSLPAKTSPGGKVVPIVPQPPAEDYSLPTAAEIRALLAKGPDDDGQR
ncbi:transposase [Azospirillum sp. INR13]|uniref:Mu transposase C-terminal domain-containing protein n=1 Tax=Azospirillum sp. INR13 TaxID=2596919 RepID=UPI0018920B31|nr:Mu transposase C-terminal domain-containing protein [Azospirillum sp. INR13]MBF5096020.1 transposase [Azospirillum sp. INR13]